MSRPRVALSLPWFQSGVVGIILGLVVCLLVILILMYGSPADVARGILPH